MLRASVGMAAVNAWFNSQATLGLVQTAEDSKAGTVENIFNEPLMNRWRACSGKRSRCSGFPISKNSEEYLDSAYEYLLPEQDCFVSWAAYVPEFNI